MAEKKRIPFHFSSFPLTFPIPSYRNTRTPSWQELDFLWRIIERKEGPAIKMAGKEPEKTIFLLENVDK